MSFALSYYFFFLLRLFRYFTLFLSILLQNFYQHFITSKKQFYTSAIYPIACTQMQSFFFVAMTAMRWKKKWKYFQCFLNVRFFIMTTRWELKQFQNCVFSLALCWFVVFLLTCNSIEVVLFAILIVLGLIKPRKASFTLVFFLFKIVLSFILLNNSNP